MYFGGGSWGLIVVVFFDSKEGILYVGNFKFGYVSILICLIFLILLFFLYLFYKNVYINVYSIEVFGIICINN